MAQIPRPDEMIEECNIYIKLLKDTEELSPEMIAMARESFKEGWVQCERRIKIVYGGNLE
jgi:oligoendopeptidase F